MTTTVKPLEIIGISLSYLCPFPIIYFNVKYQTIKANIFFLTLIKVVNLNYKRFLF